MMSSGTVGERRRCSSLRVPSSVGVGELFEEHVGLAVETR